MYFFLNINVKAITQRKRQLEWFFFYLRKTFIVQLMTFLFKDLEFVLTREINK